MTALNSMHKEQTMEEQWDEAIGKIIHQIQQQPNITTIDDAIQSLIATGGQYAATSTHAMYLQKVPESPGFTRKDVSLYLAECGEDETDLFQTYFQLVHFGGLSIEDSLRLFFTELKLEALLNKNKLDVLLLGLAKAFKANGGNFKGDEEDCLRIYNAMIMLNDSLHNKNALGRSRQTEQQFMQIINDRLANKVIEFEEDEMRRIYHNVQQCSLYQPKSMHRGPSAETDPMIQQSNAQQPASGPRSYSKYGKSGQHNDIIPSGGKVSFQDDDDMDEAPQSSGGCCIVM